MARIPFGASPTAAETKRASSSKIAKHMARKTKAASHSAVGVLSIVVVMGLCAFQFGDRNNLNSLPFARIQPLASDLNKARSLAKRGNVELFVGDRVPGQTVHLRGELSDGNCFLSQHRHAYDHAFCAKLCVAAGSPLLFISDKDEKIYLVLSPKNAVRIPAELLNHIGVPGTRVAGELIATPNVKALAIAGFDTSDSASNKR